MTLISLVMLLETPGEDGIADLVGVGVSGDSGFPVLIDLDEVLHIVGLNSSGDEGKGIKVSQHDSRD